jgi:hypothetical protein
MHLPPTKNKTAIVATSNSISKTPNNGGKIIAMV